MHWYALASCLLGAAVAHAEDKKPLRWGMDATGGAPYVFDNNTRGFEVELAEFLAKELGRLSEPVNAEWNKLPELLNNKDKLDIVLNGYEYQPAFKAQASIRYYIYKLVLVRSAGNDKLQTWDDLKVKPAGSKWKVGVLTGSAALRYLQKEYGDAIEIKEYDDVANTYSLVAQGQIDATVQDNPAARHYLNEDAAGDKKLKAIAETRAPGSYVILTRPDDFELRNQINTALKKGLENGSIARIYMKYKIWDRDQERLLFSATKTWDELEKLDKLYAGDLAEEPIEMEESVAPVMPINWRLAVRLLALAAGMTVFLAVAAMPLAATLGLAVAIIRLYTTRWLAALLTVYVEVLRGTPLLLQLYVLYYILPQLIGGLHGVPDVAIGILALALNYSASQAEHFRGAFQNLPRGQFEAALSLGFTRFKAIRYVLAPQAVRAAVPSMTNDFVAMFKDTAVCSIIAIMELTKQYNSLYNNHRDQVFALAAITATLYMAMSYPLALVARRLENRVKRTAAGT